MEKIARVIAFYLPQFHPIPENDRFWGKGFTEWTNVTKAKPLFRGHHQPNLPSELGFYDLRVSEVREAQAALAYEHGIEGFCYWHYWMGNGKLLLERPLQEVIKSGKPDFPFCVGWANHDWTGIWCGEDSRMLVKMAYLGKKDYEKHFYYLLDAFADDRYIKVKGKPLFVIFRFHEIPDQEVFIHTFRELAEKEGLGGLHMIANSNDLSSALSRGLDGVVHINSRVIEYKERSIVPLTSTLKKNSLPKIFRYKDAMKYFISDNYAEYEYPTIITNWDTTPRKNKDGVVYIGRNHDLFRSHIKEAINIAVNKSNNNNIVFLKSWNEWAEGNYIEPDIDNGRSYLEVLKEEIFI
ncbi:glycosyltransferase WbsX family protein [Catalinimonas niigatensis]|uniref:glycosyltransferase WbsX family protein n=1 Tax=Catalinimonas niigatensis TaxID=1397264 RepID=UPI0026665EB6|nr:glycoside hydrolase family 99-like domain-containing protein [Catalinimonas niigatensis]WPP52628.1 glycoside hydrolase family 99-like domain-containing protein [Catalinimonas niigatensis]